LDEAVDEYLKDRLGKARGVSMFGVAIASDESPPANSRYRGFRFQVTYAYVPLFDDLDSWELADRPPVRVEQFLLDVCNCPGKDGRSVSGVLQKQLSRIGLVLEDVVCGVGDGGGENEGMSGVHSIFEAANPTYTRRRCLGHLSWRAADAGLAEIHQDKTTLQGGRHVSDGRYHVAAVDDVGSIST
jgi:hypothetical protein